MELRQLRYFVAVAEERNFTRAARRLNMAQPPLSTQIKSLEAEVGVTLLERSSRRTELTPAGEALLASAYEILRELDLLPAKLAAAATEYRRPIALAAVPLAIPELLAETLRQARDAYPDVQLTVREMNTRDQLGVLESGAIQIGLIRHGYRSSILRQEPVLSERLLAAVPSDHDLAGRGSIKLADLASEPFVFFSREIGHWQFDEIVHACETVGRFRPLIAHQCDTIMNQLGLVSGGHGVALVTELTKSLRLDGVAYLHVTDVPLRLPLLVAWDDRNEDPLRDEVIRLIKVVATSIALRSTA